jgi:hypothetical protein
MTPPLFILSPPRSFTSVTCAMLGNHPEMFGLAETNLFAADTLGELGRSNRPGHRRQHGLLRSLAQLAFGDQTPASIAAAQEWLNDNAALVTGDVFKMMIDWSGDLCLVEKSPLSTYISPGIRPTSSTRSRCSATRSGKRPTKPGCLRAQW